MAIGDRIKKILNEESTKLPIIVKVKTITLENKETPRKLSFLVDGRKLELAVDALFLDYQELDMSKIKHIWTADRTTITFKDFVTLKIDTDKTARITD